MSIFVLIPVFNRLQHTIRVVQCLRAQTIAAQLHIVVINDGSTDDTATYLAAQPDVTTITGDGQLWWGGAIQKGLDYAMPQRAPGDYVLFLNNDTWFDADYVETLVGLSRQGGGAAVGSVIHEEGRDPPLVSVGPRVNLDRLAVWDLLQELSSEQVRNPAPTYKVDALSGRGTLYPIDLFERHGEMRPSWLPHYLADYEVAMRFARAGTPLLVSTHARVFSPPIYGNDVSHMSLKDRFFSQRSSSNIIRRLAFYVLVGSFFQRATAPLRMFLLAASRALHKLHPNQKGSIQK